MGRSNIRSQRPSQASQPRASQRTKRGAAAEENDEEVEREEGADEDEEMEAEGIQAARDGEGEITRKANALVRLALFTEHRRTPLRREDISKKVLGSNTRAFNIVLEHAQLILRKSFGMELVELPSRAALQSEKEGAHGNDDLDEARKATGMKKKAVAAGPKTYILRSVLDPLIVEHAALTHEKILEEEVADIPDNDDEDEEELRAYGSVISWSTADQLGPAGVLYVVLALILVNGRVISDMDLRANLKRLRLPSSASITFNARATHKSLSVDAYLTQLMRQGYIDRVRLGDPKGAAGAKRGRAAATQAAADDGGTWEWRWGNRAASEVGELGVAKFVAEFMVECDREGRGDEDEEEGAGGNRKRREREEVQRKLEKMMKGIERAAGGTLAEIK